MSYTELRSKKLRLVLMMTALFSLSSYSSTNTKVSMTNSDGCVECDYEFRGGADGSELNDIAKIPEKMEEKPDFEMLANALCSRILSGTVGTESSAEGMKSTVFRFMKKYKISQNPTIPEALTIMNKHKNEMTCSSGLNFVVYAMATGFGDTMYDFLENTMYDDDVFDFNGVSLVNGKPMTTLDYMEQVALKDDSITGDTMNKSRYVKMRRSIIRDYEGKRFVELSASERAPFEMMTASR